jgi:acyl-CoA thioester hydrolase
VGAEHRATDAAPAPRDVGPSADRPRFPDTEIRVRFHELDPYGHVNHGVYLNYFETARIDVLDHLGIGLEVLRDRGLHLVVVEANLRFRAPAMARDVLRVETELTRLRPASSWWRQRLVRDEPDGEVTLVAEGEVRAATSDPSGRPTATPRDLLELVAPYVTG